jgi:nitrous oxidase accessory protein NosD/actin-like ATPase involved in cell morphogenesis
MRLGVGFGTCFSSAAYVEGETCATVKDPFFLDVSIPSSVFVTPQEQVLVGKAANNQRLRDPSRYSSKLKRDLGRDVPFLLGNHPYRVEELVASVIGKIKRDADAQLTNSGRRPFTGAVLTIPATYQEHKRSLMLQAMSEAGFTKEEVTLLEEPVAAAHYYAQQNTMLEGEILLVYDLGGGTFDTALLRKKGDEFEYLALPTGIEHCGGIDFDRAIYNDVIQLHPEFQDLLQGARDDRISLMARVTVGEMCINLKHQLSLMEEVEISFVVPGTGELIEHCLTQRSFNRMIASTIEETIACCRSMIQSTAIPYKQISRILLVGGSCRIPYVQQMLRQEFQRPISVAPDLELVVCQGAAFYATQHEVFVVSSTPGEAEYTTISAALQQAKPKSLIAVCPGTYQESLVLDREIEIAGVGAQEDIIITSPDSFVLKITTASALVRGITLQHTATEGPTWREDEAVVVTKGDLTLEDCVIDAGIHGVSIWGPEGKAVMHRCFISVGKNAGIAINNGGQGIIEDCDLFESADAGIHVRDKNSFACLRRCRISHGESVGISISSAGQATIEACDISGNGSSGIQICDVGSSATIRQSRIHEGRKMGISIWQKGQASIAYCDIFDNVHAGILIADEESSASIENCKIHDGKYVGIDIFRKGLASIKDCDLECNVGAGIRVRNEGSYATIQKCHIRDGVYTGILISEKGQGGIQGCEIFCNAGPGIRICNANSKAAIFGSCIRDGNAVGIVVEDEGKGILCGCAIEGNKLDIYIEPGSTIELQPSDEIHATSEPLKQLLLQHGPDSHNIALWRQVPEPEQPKLFFFKPEELTPWFPEGSELQASSALPEIDLRW